MVWSHTLQPLGPPVSLSGHAVQAGWTSFSDLNKWRSPLSPNPFARPTCPALCSHPGVTSLGPPLTPSPGQVPLSESQSPTAPPLSTCLPLPCTHLISVSPSKEEALQGQDPDYLTTLSPAPSTNGALSVVFVWEQLQNTVVE